MEFIVCEGIMAMDSLGAALRVDRAPNSFPGIAAADWDRGLLPGFSPGRGLNSWSAQVRCKYEGWSAGVGRGGGLG